MISELSLSDEVAFRVDFDGALPPPSRPLLARAGALALRRARRGRRAAPRHAGGAFAPPERTPISYTVTLEPNDQPWLFALDLPASLPTPAGARDADRGATASLR